MLEEYIDMDVHQIMSEKVLENVSEVVQPVLSVMK
jgi:hypothetical protein